MERNKYNVTSHVKTSAELGAIVPFFCRKFEPNVDLDFTPNFYIKMAPIKNQLIGNFQIKIKFIRCALRLVWERFSDYYLDRAGANTAPPIYRKQLTGPNEDFTNADLGYYFPIHIKNYHLAETLDFNALPFRVYDRVVHEHYLRNLQALNNIDANVGGVPLIYDKRTEFNTEIGDKAPQPNIDVNSYPVYYDFYEPDMYTRLKANQTYDTLPTLGGTTFNLIDLKNFVAQSKLQEKINYTAMKTLDFISNLFGVPPPIMQRSEIIAEYRAYMDMNDVISTALTTNMPLGNNVTIAFRGDRIQPFHLYTNEFTYLIGLISIVPDSCFCNMTDDEFMPITGKENFFHPDFANVGLLPVHARECSPGRYTPGDVLEDDEIVGYRPIYQELRSPKSWVAGGFNHGYESFITHRINDPSHPPVAYNELSQCYANEYNYLFSNDEEPQVRINMNIDIQGLRPVPKVFDPETFGVGL